MKKKMILMLVLMMAVMGIAGCSGSSAETEEQQIVAESTETEVKTILVGVTNAAKPWAYLDEDNEIIGYDVDVAKEIDARIDEVTFEYKPMEFANLFLSLESGKIDMIALEVERNEERMAKYLFSDAAYNTFPSFITVLGDRDDIAGMEDLKGKSLIVTASTNQQVFAEAWNAENGNEINIVLASGGSSNEIVNQLRTGRADATLYTKSEMQSINESLGLDLKTIGEPAMANAVYHVVRKDDEEAIWLKGLVEEAVSSMIDDGTLSKISIEWLGEDYTKYLD